MINTKIKKIKEIIGACQNLKEEDLKYVLAYTSGVALNSVDNKEKNKYKY